MMIDVTRVGTVLQTVTAVAERGQMRLFATATGQTDPRFFDDKAAGRAGFRGIVAAPTFGSCLYAAARDDPFELYQKLDIDIRRVLHASQSFRYLASICCGDTMTFTSEVIDIFDKKAGALQFVVQRTTATNQFDEVATIFESTIAVRSVSTPR